MPEIVGAFAPLTVRANVSLALLVPSLTVTVIVAPPAWLGAGVTFTVLLLPLPPKVMLPAGTSAGLDDDALITRLFTGVSTSLTVKGITPVGVFTVVERSAMSLM